jgi:hypothetical protein
VWLCASHDWLQVTGYGSLHVHGRLQPFVHDLHMRKNIFRALVEQMLRRKMATPARYEYDAGILHLRHNSHFC